MLKGDILNRLDSLPYLSDEIKNENIGLWEQRSAKKLKTETVYGPWVQTLWDQDLPYNKYCPYDDISKSTSVVGCVATAMAQVVNYFEYPSSIKFSTADNYNSSQAGDEECNANKTLNIKINTASYNISKIVYPIYDEDDLAARLSAACGVSVKMQYSFCGSSAAISKVVSTLKNKFGYKSARALSPILFETLNDCTNNFHGSLCIQFPQYDPPSGYEYAGNFYDIIKNNIKNGQPVILSINTAGYKDGHAIIADGYNENLNTYHLNFGWGDYDGLFYVLPEKMPSDYSIVYGAVVDIKSPNAIPSPKPVHKVTDIQINAKDNQTLSVNWAFEYNDAVLFEVWRREAKSYTQSFKLIGTSTSNKMFQDANAIPFIDYEYVVRYKNKYGNYSKFSEPVTGHSIVSPDFVVKSIVLSPSLIESSKTFNATVTIGNIGKISDVGGYLYVYANQLSTKSCENKHEYDTDFILVDNKYEQYVGKLEVGISKSFTFTGLSAGSIGKKTFRAFVDSSCQTLESNERNNQKSLTYTVAEHRLNIVGIRKKGTQNYNNYAEMYIFESKDIRKIATHVQTPFGIIDEWQFEVADWNNDGQQDIVGICTKGSATNTIDIHVLNGKTNEFYTHVQTPFGIIDEWQFEVADWNNDGQQDIVGICTKGSATNTIDIHVLNGKTNEFYTHVQTPFGIIDEWQFKVADWNCDGQQDIVGFCTKGGHSHTTEVHVLNGKNMKEFLTHVDYTPIPEAGDGWDWDFAVADWY